MEQKTEASQAVDERALFEQHFLDNASDKEGAKLLLSFRHENGKYEAPWLNDQLWGWQARAALKAQPAPTDPYQLDDDDDARFPNDTNVVILHIDLYWHLRGCEDICAALDAKPAPTEATQPDRRTLQAEGKHPAPCARHCEATAFGIETRRLTAENARLRAAQGEDSARLDWLEANKATLSRMYDDSAYILAVGGSGIRSDVSARAAIDFAIDRARASAETGGVKP